MRFIEIVRALAALLVLAAVVFAALTCVGIFTALDSATAAYASSGWWRIC